MKFSKLTVAIATVLGAIASTDASAIDLYVDTKTNQIFAAPGRGRVLMGSFVRADEAAKKTAAPAQTAELAKIREDLELKDNQIKALEEHAKEAHEMPEVKLEDGIEFKTRDGNFKAAINGRMQVDSQVNTNNQVNSTAAKFPNSTASNLADGVGIRRARLGVEGTMFKAWDYKFEYDFTRGNGTVAAGVTDAYVRYNINKPFSVKVGAFKEPFSLEEATSNRFITFLERNMAVNTFIDNPNTYKVGIGANYAAERYNLSTSFQTEPVGGNPSGSTSSASSINTNGGSNRNNGSGSTGYEFNGRVTGLPWMQSKTKFWHLGASGSYVNVNNNYTNAGGFNNGGFSFVSALNNNVDRTNILNTGNLTYGAVNGKGAHQINNFNRFGVESAVVYGPFSAQAEYLQTDVFGKGYNGNALYGYYGYVTYFLTGESRAYKEKTAAWDRLKPNKNFNWQNGGWGAWEVAAGYDSLNLNAGDVRGGRASTFKIGLNWYPNSHIRVMSNFIHVLSLNTVGSGGVQNINALTNNTAAGFNNASLDVFELRTQVDF